MSQDLHSITRFIKSFPPFDRLDAPALEQLITQIRVLYVEAGDHSHLIDTENPRIFLLRKGAVDVLDAHGELVDRVDPGSCFGLSLLMTGKRMGNQVLMSEECLLYAMPVPLIQSLRQSNPSFDQFFEAAFARRLRSRNLQPPHQWTQRVQDLMSSRVISVESHESAVAAARAMTEARVSSVLIMEDKRLVGILTDRDLRARLVANEADMQAPVKLLMTPDPVTIEPGALAHEITFRMLQQNIHHLPVVHEGVPVGLVSASDMLRGRHSDPVFLVSRISKCQDLDELRTCANQTQKLLFELIRAEASPESIGQIFTGINDSLTRRLIQMAEAELGEAPVPYCWMAFGSQARNEQHAGSDQDNGLIFDGDESHQAWFLELARRVCHGLDHCGFPYCPGDVMAQTSDWCQPMSGWLKAFNRWIDTPEPKAVMYSSIFFDLRPIAGDLELCKRLQTQVLEKARKSTIFLGLLTKNAVSRRTPLGFFKQFIVAKGGDHHQALDLKHQGLALITDIARVHALAAGLSATATPARLRACRQAGQMTAEDEANLLEAFDFICDLRFRQQLQQLENGKKPDNYVSPKKLNSLQRNHLKAVFRVLDDSQNALSLKFARGMA